MTKSHFVRPLISFGIPSALAFLSSGVLLTTTFAQPPTKLSTAVPGSGRNTHQQATGQTKKEDAPTVAGKWVFVFDNGEGDEREETATFQQDGTKVTGKFVDADVQGTFQDSQLDLSFPYTTGEGRMSGTLNIKGKLENDALKGTWDFDKFKGTFTATRSK